MSVCPMRRSFALMAVVLCVLAGAARADVGQLQQSFNAPPDDCKIMTRYWWFGPAVTKSQIDRDFTAMKAGGFGGMEVNPVYPMAVDGQYPGLKNLTFLSPEFFDMLNYAGVKAKELGLRMNLTLGSGWPYGGPMFTPAEGAGRIMQQSVTTTAGQATARATLRAGQSIAAVLVAPAGVAATAAVVVPFNNATATAAIPANLARQACTVVFYLNGRVGMQVKRATNGAQGLVIDHLSPTVVDKFIEQVAGPEVKAVGNNALASIFCDSLEVGGEDWSDTLLDEFQKRRGYDLRPLLPALFDNNFPRAADIRHDWGQTQTEMFNDNFVAKFAKFAKENNTKFRIQAYGSPAAAQMTYAASDLPEGEMGHQTLQGFNDCRYAASATHLLGVPVASSETFTWLKDTVFRATPLDMKSESNWQFLQGINQLICHGWPSTSDNVPYPGWTFYVAAVFNQNNPWYIAMPDTTRYLQRVSFMMRQGQPANDVAFYLPDSDAWASFRPGTASVTTAEAGRITQSGAVTGILNAGYNFDYWDDALLATRGEVSKGALNFGDLHYKIVVLANVERMPLATVTKLEDFVNGGGTIVCIGTRPSIVPGYKATDADQKALRDSMTRMFGTVNAPGITIANASGFGAAIAKKFHPDFELTPNIPAIGFVHRHMDDADIYFVANTSNQHQDVVANFRVEKGNPEYWDPMTGKVSPAAVIERVDGGTSLALHIEPYGTRLVIFSDRTLPPANIPIVADIPKPIDLSTNWTVTFGKGGKPTKMNQLTDWIATPATANFSGVATYQHTVTVPASMIRDGLALTLSLGPDYVAASAGGGGGRVGRGGGGGGGQSMAATIDTPVREVAVVTVNGTRAGALWSPPYTLDITSLLKAGDNDVSIDVGNTAINYASANGLPDFAAAIRQFGNRAAPPQLRGTALIPSGLFGPIQLIPAQAKP